MAKGKRAQNGMGTVRKTSTGRWEGRLTIGYDPLTGKQKQKYVSGKTQKEVREKMISLQQELITDSYIEPNKMTLAEWMEVWIRDYSLDKKYSTVKGYKASIKKHINPKIGKYRLDQLNPVIIQKFYNELINPVDGEEPLMPKSAKNVYICLKAALNQAVDNEMLKKNPCAKTKLAKIEKKQVKTLDDQQVRDFVALCAGDIYYGHILRLIVFTGLRVSEAMGITWDAIDFDKGTIVIDKQLQHRPESAGGTVLSSVKNNKPRVILPAPFVMNELRIRYTEQKMQALYAGSAWEAWKNEKEHKKALVFTNEVGHHLIQKRVYLHFKKKAIEIGAPNARVHDLRHTYAVLSLQNGDDIKTVQENLGHASAAFTLDVYGHVSVRMKKESSERMQNFISNLASES